MRVLIAVSESNGKSSKLSEHFGHCPYFAIFDTDSKNFEIVKNEIDHSNQNMSPVDQVMKFKPNLVFSKGIGSRAINLFEEKGVGIKTGDYETADEVLINLYNLKKIEEGCNH